MTVLPHVRLIFLMKVIGGSAAKKYGGKNILTLAVFMWSLSTFITPFFATSIYGLILLRVILGIGEGIGKSLFDSFETNIPSNV